MEPLVKAATLVGLCTVGRPPSYRPSQGAVAYGLLLCAMWPVILFFVLSKSLLVAYDVAPFGPKKRNDTLDIQDKTRGHEEWGHTDAGRQKWGRIVFTLIPLVTLMFSYNETLSTEVPSTEAPVPGVPVPPDFVPSEMDRIISLASSTAEASYILGLFVGFFRKLRHLPVVFRRSDELPGKVRWKTALFVVEMMVFVVPPSAWILRAFSEDRSLSNLELYSFITLLVTIEKLMMLHLVTRVGSGFDHVTGRLTALRTAQGETRNKRPSGPGSESPLIDEVLNLRRLHLNFHGLLERIERAYEVQIVSFLVAEFITTVITLYLLARSLYQGTMEPKNLIALLFLILITQVTVLLFATCRSTSLKGNATTAVVTKLLNDKQLDKEEVHELMTFSMQLKHLEVSVSAYDTVTMDFSTLQALVANVAMHIVVLTQFNLSTGP